VAHTIESLVKRRQRWIDVNKENNFEEGIKRLLTELYPDNAHFIYELLQNAEDTCASAVRFTLSNEEIGFEHNGERLFDLLDVESITSIGASTKRDDPTLIGKFGVGFKAVFAYTSTPEIHSGDFHFRIQDLVVPVTNGVKINSFVNKETRIIIPFDHPTKLPPQAVEEIKNGLQDLGDNTLLFLNHIHLIEYSLPDGSLGSLERIKRKNGDMEIRVSHPGGEKTVTHWLRYQKDVDVDDEDGKTKTCRIAIAYSVQREDKKKDHPKWKIIPVEHAQVSIYFPAEKETSKLRFHIHAPFASTVARDSVRDCEANRQLRNCIAELVVDSLTDIRDRGMLTMGFLAVLPNQTDSLSGFYEPIRAAVVGAFKAERFTPTRSGTHAPADGLYRGPAKIAEVLSDEDLSLLTICEPPLWAANPPQQNQREDRFLDSLEIDSWGWSELSSTISQTGDDERETIEAWIAQKDDAWVLRFYALLGEACEEHSEYLYADDLRIVRIEVDQSIEHVLPQEAFFPTEHGIAPTRDIRFVKPTVYSTGRSVAQRDFAVAFLEHIGVRTFDEKTDIELRLGFYPPDSIVGAYYKEIAQFVVYWKKNEDTELFKKHTFLLGELSNGKLYWRMPEQLCMDLPFEETGLKELMTIHKKDVLWGGYKDKLNEKQYADFKSFLRAVGVMYRVNVSQAPIWYNPQRQEIMKGLGGTRKTSTCINEDYSIDNLDRYLKLQTISASRLVWQALVEADSRVSKARYRPNQEYLTQEIDSQLIYHLKNCKWIPDKSGAFYKAKDMTRDDLRTDFPYDDRNGLLTAIGFGGRANELSEEYISQNYEAKKMGFESADEALKLAQLARLIRDSGHSLDSLLDQYRPNLEQIQPSFPSRPVANPERRQEHLGEQLNDAPDKVYEKRERSVRTTNGAIDPITWLRSQYTNEADQMVCQICKEEMPFRKRDGTHYFEKKEVLSKKYLPKEHEAQYLALCPLCAAMYEEFLKSVDDAMADLKAKLVSTGDCEVPITLGDQETSIRFVETHLHDLKVIIG
jgi:hypothetical protein